MEGGVSDLLYGVNARYLFDTVFGFKDIRSRTGGSCSSSKGMAASKDGRTYGRVRECVVPSSVIDRARVWEGNTEFH